VDPKPRHCRGANATPRALKNDNDAAPAGCAVLTQAASNDDATTVMAVR